MDQNGKGFGKHRGQLYYTIGQRARLGGMQGRWFVARKGVGEDKNDILLVQGGYVLFVMWITMLSLTAQ